MHATIEPFDLLKRHPLAVARHRWSNDLKIVEACLIENSFMTADAGYDPIHRHGDHIRP
jgi:hypothetical protein